MKNTENKNPFLYNRQLRLLLFLADAFSLSPLASRQTFHIRAISVIYITCI